MGRLVCLDKNGPQAECPLSACCHYLSCSTVNGYVNIMYEIVKGKTAFTFPILAFKKSSGAN